MAARYEREDVVVVREVAAEQARAREIRVRRGVIEERDVQIRLLAVTFLHERQLRQRAAARIDLAGVDVRGKIHELVCGARSGCVRTRRDGCAWYARSGRQIGGLRARSRGSRCSAADRLGRDGAREE